MIPDRTQDKTPRRKRLSFIPVENPELKQFPVETREFYVFGDWASFIQTYNINAENRPAEVADFEKYFLVAVHQGLCPTGGYGIRISRVEGSAATIDIYLEFKEPHPGQTVTLTMTCPSVSFLVPRMGSGEPVFRFFAENGQFLAERTPMYGT